MVWPPLRCILLRLDRESAKRNLMKKTNRRIGEEDSGFVPVLSADRRRRRSRCDDEEDESAKRKKKKSKTAVADLFFSFFFGRIGEEEEEAWKRKKRRGPFCFSIRRNCQF
ncbi:hypothetical protein Syun_006727 [Stephania yunnanensis]|uniref:Uncharacterized protein n=1 Tax=Stephania yunnanensis TaxID=152371 RepID=A0AAP0KXB1_9MAGN